MGSTVFAGLAGQVVRDFLSLRSLVHVLPFLLLVLVLGAGGLATTTFLVPLTPGLQALVALLVISPVLAHDALMARFGQRPTVVEVVLFVIRFGLLVLLWGAPLLAAFRAFSDELTLPAQLNVEGFLAADAWPPIIALCLAGIYLLAATHLSLIVAAAADGLLETFSPGRWLWVVREHSADLPASLAALTGGVTLFYLTALPVTLLLAAGLAQINVYLGVACAMVGYLSPIAAGCLLAARLAGALAALRDAPDEAPDVGPADLSIPLSDAARAEAPISAPMLVRDKIPGVRTGADSLPGLGAMDFIQAIQNLELRGDSDLDGAIREAEALFEKHPKSAGVLAELAKLYRRAGRDDEAVRTCGRAIALALHGGMSPVALETFESFAAHRDRLALDADTWGALAKVLRFRGHEADADWCEGRAGEGAG